MAFWLFWCAIYCLNDLSRLAAPVGIVARAPVSSGYSNLSNVAYVSVMKSSGTSYPLWLSIFCKGLSADKAKTTCRVCSMMGWVCDCIVLNLLTLCLGLV